MSGQSRPIIEPPLERFALSIDLAAETLSLSPAYLIQLCDAGIIRTIRVGRRRLVPKTALTAFVERLDAEQNGAGYDR